MKLLNKSTAVAGALTGHKLKAAATTWDAHEKPF